jgi:hypothetical protein
MKLSMILSVGLTCFMLASPALAAVTTVATRGLAASDLDGLIAIDDALSGLIAAELPGDLGWHPANPASGDPEDPNGLPAFTDDDGFLSGTTGLLNDFPTLGSPTKLLQYDLAAPTNIEKIGILSGNLNNADGRIFTTSVIRYSINGGADYSLLGYFESAPLGSINNEQGVPGSTEDHALHLEIFDDASTVMIAGVTNLQFDFYAVDNTQGQYRDPFDGVNPFTEIDDGLTAAISSPLIWEIDVIGQGGSVASADFDGNQVVDGNDFLIWQRGFGGVGTGTPSTGDANGDLDVDGDDLTIWKSQFGGAAISAIPEPSALLLACLAVAPAMTARKSRSQLH